MRALTTQRLTMRPAALSDFDDLVAQWRDPEFTRHISGVPSSPEDVWSRLLRDIGHVQALGHGGWILRVRETGAYVGGLGVFDFHREVDPPLDAPEVGWGIVPAFQRRGLAAEALTAGLAWVDDELRAPRTVCMIAPANEPSIKLATRAGFTRHGTGTYKSNAVHLFERARPPA